MLGLDAAFAKAQEIADQTLDNAAGITTEEDTKIQIITRLLTECLGWSFSDISAETKHENGYSDYILSNDGKPALLIEAKRIGSIEIGTTEKDRVRYLKIAGPGLKKAIVGIDQAVGYAAPNGLPVVVLTDGSAWIVFKTFVPGDNFKNKEAVVFPSLRAVLTDFSIFYELVSKEQIGKKLYNPIFDRIHQPRLLLTRPLKAPISEDGIKITQKTDLAFDLDQVFSIFFTRLTGDGDEDLLIECFVETRESRIADFSLEKMTATVLAIITLT